MLFTWGLGQRFGRWTDGLWTLGAGLSKHFGLLWAIAIAIPVFSGRVAGTWDCCRCIASVCWAKSLAILALHSAVMLADLARLFAMAIALGVLGLRSVLLGPLEDAEGSGLTQVALGEAEGGGFNQEGLVTRTFGSVFNNKSFTAFMVVASSFLLVANGGVTACGALKSAMPPNIVEALAFGLPLSLQDSTLLGEPAPLTDGLWTLWTLE